MTDIIEAENLVQQFCWNLEYILKKQTVLTKKTSNLEFYKDIDEKFKFLSKTSDFTYLIFYSETS